jgi:hypothetical protein
MQFLCIGFYRTTMNFYKDTALFYTNDFLVCIGFNGSIDAIN